MLKLFINKHISFSFPLGRWLFKTIYNPRVPPSIVIYITQKACVEALTLETRLMNSIKKNTLKYVQLYCIPTMALIIFIGETRTRGEKSLGPGRHSWEGVSKFLDYEGVDLSSRLTPPEFKKKNNFKLVWFFFYWI